MSELSPPGNSFRAAVLSGRRPSLIVEEKKGRLDGNGDALQGAMIPRTEGRSANHRDLDRHRLDQELAFAHHDGARREVELINLSGGGAMIRSGFTPNLWDVVELEMGEGARLEAVVRWVKGDLAGLEFAHETRIECGPEQRARLLLDVIQRSFPDCSIDLELPELPEEAAPAADPIEQLRGRSEARHPLIWSGQILFAFDSNPVRLRNISSSGALVDVVIPYPVGSQVMLDLGEAGQIDSLLTWAKGDQAGLKFIQAFDLERLASLRPEVTEHRWQKPDFLKSGKEDSSPWDEKWRRKPIGELQAELESFLKH